MVGGVWGGGGYVLFGGGWLVKGFVVGGGGGWEDVHRCRLGGGLLLSPGLINGLVLSSAGERRFELLMLR